MWCIERETLTNSGGATGGWGERVSVRIQGRADAEHAPGADEEAAKNRAELGLEVMHDCVAQVRVVLSRVGTELQRETLTFRLGLFKNDKMIADDDCWSLTSTPLFFFFSYVGTVSLCCFCQG